MKSSIGYFLQDYLEEFVALDKPQHWIILFKEALFKEISLYAAIEMPLEASCQGQNWIFKNGGRITLACLENPVIQGSDRLLCISDGSPYSADDIKFLSSWKKN